MKRHLIYAENAKIPVEIRYLNKIFNEDTKKSTRKRRLHEDSDSYSDNYDEDCNKRKYDTNEDAVRSKRKYTKNNDEIPNEKVDSNTISCPVCYDDVKISYVTMCNHNFCYSCVDKLISMSNNNEWACPICRKICKK